MRRMRRSCGRCEPLSSGVLSLGFVPIVGVVLVSFLSKDEIVVEMSRF